MKIGFIRLRPRLSAISWSAIELFLIMGLFFLPYSKSLAEIFMTLSLVLWVFRKFPLSETLPEVRVASMAYSFLVLFLVLSLIQVPVDLRAHALRGIGKWLQLLGLAFMSVDYFRNERRRTRFFYCLILVLSGLCLNGLYQISTGVDAVKSYAAVIPGSLSRMSGSLSSPNSLAAFLILGIPLAFYFWRRPSNNRILRILFALIFILFGTSLLLTLSRTALFGLCIAASFYLFIKRKNVLLSVGLLGSSVFLVALALGNGFFRGLLVPLDLTVESRFTYWQAAWKMVKAHPFLGNGAGLFTRLAADFEPALKNRSGHAYNSLLEIWAEAGLGALLAFLVPAIYLLWNSGRKFRQGFTTNGLEEALWVGTFAFLVQSLFDTNLFSLQTSFLFWILWGSLMALSVKKEPTVPKIAPAATSTGK